MLLWTVCAWAQEASVIMDALVEEMERGVAELKLEDAPPIYHLRYHALFMEQAEAHASFGAIVARDASPYRALGIELRVGDPNYDNTGFGGWQNGFGRRGLPRAADGAATRLGAWRLTDGAYKQAVEQYARKKAQFTAPDEYPGDYTLRAGDVADLGAGPAADAKALEGRARTLSAVFGREPGLLRGEVFLGHETGSWMIVDTEGTRIRKPASETTIRAFGHLRAGDGALLADQRLWTVRDDDDLPSIEQMEAEIEELVAGLRAYAAAPNLPEEYVGPVIFEEHAALDLFRFLLVPQLEGTPPEVPFDSFFGDLGGGGGGSVRIMRRVLPIGWRVVDDPALQPDHPAVAAYDMEGTPVEAVELVRDGIVRDLLMCRIPRKGASQSNGHARGLPGDRASARAMAFEVEPDKRVSSAKLRKKALKIAASYGRDYVLVVRRLQEPGMRGYGEGGFSMFGGDSESALPMPLGVVRLFADGREELVRGARFADVQRWVLRDILAVGTQRSGSFMAHADPSGSAAGLSPTQGMPTWISAPDVLIGEMELEPAPGDPRDNPLVPPPAMATKGTDPGSN